MPDGFLSADIGQTIAGVRSRANLIPWFDLLGPMNNLAMRLMPNLKVPDEDHQRLLEAVLFARAVQSLQAGILLAERGMEADARSALRAAAETTIFLQRMSEDPTLKDRMVENDAYYRKNRALAFLRDPGFMAEATTEDKEKLQRAIAEIDAEYSAASARKLNVAKEAEQGNALHLYNLIFRPTSNDAAHTSLASLVRHFSEKEGGTASLQFGPQLESTSDTLAGLACVFVFALHPVFARFSLKEFEGEGDNLVGRWRELMGEGRN